MDLYIFLIFCSLINVGVCLQAAEVRGLTRELGLASCSLVIMEPGVTEVTRAWSEARSSLCSYLSCYSISSMENTQLHFPSGVTVKVQDQESLLHTPGQHDVGGTTCVVSVWKSVPASGPEFVRSLCRGMKR